MIASSAFLGFALAAGSAANLQPADWTSAIDHAAQSNPDARIVILRVSDGRMIATHHLQALSQTLAAPGSTLKPILLYQSLQTGLWSADRVVPCQRNLTIRDHRLACSHPPAPPFAAREALTWSCNTYFAEMARALPPGHLEQMLRTSGLLTPSRLVPDEPAAEFHRPRNAEDVELEALGVEGLRVTPLELAVAYRWLAVQMMSEPNSIATRTVRGGLSDSATFGIADEAQVGGVSVAGKTGTAENPGSMRSHGWFAGFSPAINPAIVLVVYLPAGRGADAARIAGVILGRSPSVRR